MTELSTEKYILYNKTIIRGRNVLVQHVRGRNILVRNVRKRNVLGAKRPVPKRTTAKRPGPKSLGQNGQVQNIKGRNVLVQKRQGVKRPGPKKKVRVRKHFLSLHFMIVKLPLWLWHSLRLLYDFEVLLLLSSKFDLWLVNWFDLIRGNMILLIENFHLEMTF